jgi:DNA-binding MarR family transcriptional regulator
VSGGERVAVSQMAIRYSVVWPTKTGVSLGVAPIAVTARLARLQAVLSPKLEAVFERFGIRRADFAVLATLVRLGRADVSQRRLGRELGLSPATISLRIDRLVRRGLVNRGTDPTDGRGALLSLTGPGRELFEACAPQHLANAETLLAGLDEHEREQFGALLGKLLYILEEPAADDAVEPELGMIVEAAPVALERRRAVGLPPLAGLLVRHVHPTGPAAAGGMRPGDLIRSANRRPLRSGHDLALALTETRRRPLTLEVVRGTEPMSVKIDAVAGTHRSTPSGNRLAPR